jgi:hypothetical protein
VSGQVKGFAFIEYSTAEEAKAALEVSLTVDREIFVIKKFSLIIFPDEN